MKKFLLSTAIFMGTVMGFATTIDKLPNSVKITVQEDFKEIKADQVPDAVNTALKTAYPDATLDKAYVNSLKEYKLEITVRDQKATVYTDANGNWIKK